MRNSTPNRKLLNFTSANPLLKFQSFPRLPRPACPRSPYFLYSSPSHRTAIHSHLEESYLVSPGSISGAIPSDLVGTFYWLIPSPAPHFSSNGIPGPEHPFDGDGYVLAVGIGEQVWVRGRFVRTKAFMRERKEGRRCFKGRYGDHQVGGMFGSKKMGSNEGLIVLGEKGKETIIAWDNSGLPYRLRGSTLNTRGMTNLKGVLAEEGVLRDRGNAVGGTVNIGDGKLAMMTIGRNAAGRATGLFFVELDKASGVMSRTPKIALSKDATVEGISKTFTVTARYYVYAEAPLKKGLFSRKDQEIIDARSLTKLTFVARGNGGAESFAVPVDATLIEIFRAAEKGNIISVDVIKGANLSPEMDLSEFITSKGVVCRYTVDVQSREVIEESTINSPDFLLHNAVADNGDTYCCSDDRVVKLGASTIPTWKSPSRISGLYIEAKYVAILSGSRLVFLTKDELNEIAAIEIKPEGLGRARGAAKTDTTWIYDEWLGRGTTAWELFDERRWNDMDSSFSGLGLNSLR